MSWSGSPPPTKSCRKEDEGEEASVAGGQVSPLPAKAGFQNAGFLHIFSLLRFRRLLDLHPDLPAPGIFLHGSCNTSLGIQKHRAFHMLYHPLLPFFQKPPKGQGKWLNIKISLWSLLSCKAKGTSKMPALLSSILWQRTFDLDSVIPVGIRGMKVSVPHTSSPANSGWAM